MHYESWVEVSMDVNNIDYCDTATIDEAAAKFVEVLQPIKEISNYIHPRKKSK